MKSTSIYQTRELTKKEKLFCYFFAETNNLAEAAAKAGLPSGKNKAAALLQQKAIQQELKSCRHAREALSALQVARVGLERLAFGESNDAVALAFAEELPCAQELAGMNLFGVTEIKKTKGGCEIKLADRMKALELLAELPSPKGEGAAAFFAALEKGATREPLESLAVAQDADE